MTSTTNPELDVELHLEQLAQDIAAICSRYNYSIHASAADILPALRPFIVNVQKNADRRRLASSDDVAKWTATADLEGTDPPARTGPAPEMIFRAWWEDQGVELGSCGQREHYWRCPLCRDWLGPYVNILHAKQIGMDHRFREHDLPRARRTEAHRAARKASRGRLLIAQFDTLVTELSAAHNVDIRTMHLIVIRVAGAINRYGRVSDLLFSLVHDGVFPTEHVAATVTADIAGRLGSSWFTDPRT